MLRFRKGVPLLTLLSAGMLFFASAGPASADFQLVVEMFNGTSASGAVTVTPTTAGIINGVLNVGGIVGSTYSNNGAIQTLTYTNSGFDGGALNLTVNATNSNSPSATVPAEMDTSVAVSLNPTFTESKSLVIGASDTSFTVPTGTNLPMTSLLTGSGPAGGTATYQGWVASGDQLFAVGSTTATLYGSPFVAGTGVKSPGALSAPPYSPNPSDSTTVPSLNNPFSMSVLSTFAGFSTTTQYSVDNKTDVYGSPVPASLAMALSGLSVLGLGRFLRRGKA